LAEADEVAGALQVTPRGLLRVYCHRGLSRSSGGSSCAFWKITRKYRSILRTGDVMIDLVQEGFDLAIMPSSPPDSTLIKRTLAKWHPLLCGSRAYLDLHPAPRTPADLADHNLLRYAYSPYGPEVDFVDPAAAVK
jgi:DNA-binding transcriptional LysR family regulator